MPTHLWRTEQRSGQTEQRSTDTEQGYGAGMLAASRGYEDAYPTGMLGCLPQRYFNTELNQLFHIVFPHLNGRGVGVGVVFFLPNIVGSMIGRPSQTHAPNEPPKQPPSTLKKKLPLPPWSLKSKFKLQGGRGRGGFLSAQHRKTTPTPTPLEFKCVF